MISVNLCQDNLRREMRTFKEGEEEMSLSYPFLQIPFIDAVGEEQLNDEEIVETQEERGREEEIDNFVGENTEEKLTNDAEESQKEEKDCRERKEEKRGDKEKGRLGAGRSIKKKREGNSEEEEEERVNEDERQKKTGRRNQKEKEKRTRISSEGTIDILWENENQGEGVNGQGEDNGEMAHQQRKIPRVDTWCSSPSISKSPSAPLHQQPASSAAMSSGCNLSATKIARSSSSPWLREHNRWSYYIIVNFF